MVQVCRNGTSPRSLFCMVLSNVGRFLFQQFVGKVNVLLAKAAPTAWLLCLQAIYDRQTVDVRFNEIIHKHMLKQEIDFGDMKLIDPIFCKSLEVITLRSFSWPPDHVVSTVDADT